MKLINNVYFINITPILINFNSVICSTTCYTCHYGDNIKIYMMKYNCNKFQVLCNIFSYFTYNIQTTTKQAKRRVS